MKVTLEIESVPLDEIEDTLRSLNEIRVHAEAKGRYVRVCVENQSSEPVWR